MSNCIIFQTQNKFLLTSGERWLNLCQRKRKMWNNTLVIKARRNKILQFKWKIPTAQKNFTFWRKILKIENRKHFTTLCYMHVITLYVCVHGSHQWEQCPGDFLVFIELTATKMREKHFQKRKDAPWYVYILHSSGPVHVNPDIIIDYSVCVWNLTFSSGEMAGSMGCYKLNPWLHKFGETTLTLWKHIETNWLPYSSSVKCVSWGTYCLCTNGLDKGLHGWDQLWEEHFCTALLHPCEPGLGKLRWHPQTQVNPTHRRDI